MFNWVYFLVTGSKAFRDPLNVYRTYFIKDGAFDNAFLISLAIGLVLCVCYYLYTRKSMSFANIGTWFVTLFVAAVLSFGASAYTVGIGTTNRGLGHTLEMQARKQQSNAEETSAKKRKLRQDFNKGVFRCAPVNTFCRPTLPLVASCSSWHLSDASALADTVAISPCDRELFI